MIRLRRRDSKKDGDGEKLIQSCPYHSFQHPKISKQQAGYFRNCNLLKMSTVLSFRIVSYQKHRSIIDLSVLLITGFVSNERIAYTNNGDH